MEQQPPLVGLAGQLVSRRLFLQTLATAVAATAVSAAPESTTAEPVASEPQTPVQYHVYMPAVMSGTLSESPGMPSGSPIGLLLALTHA